MYVCNSKFVRRRRRRQAGKRPASRLVFPVGDLELLLHGQLERRYPVACRDRRHAAVRAFQRRVEAVCV